MPEMLADRYYSFLQPAVHPLLKHIISQLYIKARNLGTMPLRNKGGRILDDLLPEG